MQTLAKATTAVELWSAMVAHAGLRPHRRKDGTESYDSAFETSIRQTLRLGRAPMLTALRAANTSLEALLEALLRRLGPWAKMLRDILSMLEQAQAIHSGHTVELHVRWSRLSQGLVSDLNAFRRSVETVEAVVGRARGAQWGYLDLFDPRLVGGSLSTEALPLEYRQWQIAYRKDARHDPPPPPATGYAELELQMDRLYAAVCSHLFAVRLMGGTRDERWAAASAADGQERHLPDGWTPSRVATVDHDGLADRALLQAIAVTRAPGFGPTEGRALAGRLKEVLDEVPIIEGDVRSDLRALNDLLDLPVWRYRHELYSVWIAALIRSSVSRPWAWNAPSRVLSFAFGGSKVASVDLEDFEGVLWAELRRSANLPHSKKKRRHVQPDYTFLLADDRLKAPAGLIVECKQYRNPSRSNFDSALEDYAAAHPYAPIALVNYGRLGLTSAAQIGKIRPAPVAAFGEVCPGGGGVEHFVAFVRAASRVWTSMAATLDQPMKAQSAAKVTLRWEAGEDLDLHVAARDAYWPNTRVGFGAPRSARAQTMVWSGDSLRPGQEDVEIHLPPASILEIYVHRYSGEWPAGQTYLDLQAGSLRSTLAPPSGDEAWWHVGTLDTTKLTFTPGNLQADAPW